MLRVMSTNNTVEYLKLIFRDSGMNSNFTFINCNAFLDSTVHRETDRSFLNSSDEDDVCSSMISGDTSFCHDNISFEEQRWEAYQQGKVLTSGNFK